MIPIIQKKEDRRKFFVPDILPATCDMQTFEKSPTQTLVLDT